MVVKLYLDYLSQPCRALGLFCKVNNIPFEYKYTNLRKGEHKSAEYLKLTPFGAVPMLEEEGWMLTESIAILKYLQEKNEAAASWWPSESRARAKVEEYLCWHHRGLREVAVGLFFPIAFLNEREPEIVRKNRDKFETALNHIENYFLKESPFLGGSSLSLADLLALCELQQNTSIGYDVTRARPKLEAWLTKVKAALQPHLDEITQDIMEFGAQITYDFDAL